MPQLGFQELVLIFIIALLVFGPKKLPELGKSLGKGLREFKKATNDLKANWEDQIRDAEHSIEEVKQTVHETTRDINATDSTPAGTTATKETTSDGRSN